MNKVWLVYRPAIGYEESERPYFVCLTKALAVECAKRMIGYAQILQNRLPELPETPSLELPEDHPEWVAFDNVWTRFEKIRDRARWPYGIDLFDDRDSDGMVAVKALEIRSKA